MIYESRWLRMAAVSSRRTMRFASAAFLASKNSAVFHRPGCKSAAKIASENLIRYAFREEAVQAGERPCAECRP
jgi:methylphosphotriester-DNA--protein-cysteine methyltransferase